LIVGAEVLSSSCSAFMVFKVLFYYPNCHCWNIASHETDSQFGVELLDKKFI
ncbi:unnamed protein product, partial [Urochloa humidicola]